LAEKKTQETTAAQSSVSNDLTEYERGYLDGLWAYAWWKNGVAYVGSTGSTYQQAVKRFLAERGKKGWDVKFRTQDSATAEATE
jgi:hypothetical protein